jgi:hypothetical protein
MTTTPILAIEQIASNENQPEVVANDGFLALEDATQNSLAVSLSAGNVTLTAGQFTRYAVFICSGHTVARELIVPLTKRVFGVINSGTGNVTVKGATGTSAVLVPGEGLLCLGEGTNILPFRTSQPYETAFYVSGLIPEVTNVVRHVFARTVIFPANFAGSYAAADEAATASTVFSVLKNGATVGAITFAISAATATFTTSGGTPVTFVAGDVLEVTPPTPDATLADIAFNLVGAR